MSVILIVASYLFCSAAGATGFTASPLPTSGSVSGSRFNSRPVNSAGTRQLNSQSSIGHANPPPSTSAGRASPLTSLSSIGHRNLSSSNERGSLPTSGHSTGVGSSAGHRTDLPPFSRAGRSNISSTPTPTTPQSE